MNAVKLRTLMCLGGWLACWCGWLALAIAGFDLSAASPPIARIDVSELFFNSGVIPHLFIEVTGTNLDLIRMNDRRDVHATVREGKATYSDVALHVKGAAGSRRPFEGDKPALTLNFDKFKGGQHFHGLDKLHLNNSVQDHSYLTEHLCSTLFREAGVPSPRVTHARVTLNGRDLGLFVLKEGFDKEFLRRWFRTPNGNLYDGGFLRDITEPLERTSGEGRTTRADLKALAAAAREPDLSLRLAKLERVLDVDRFLSFIAGEIMTWHWDGYAMKKNNYRVYHDPSTDKMVFLPHGLDQMFWFPNQSIFPSMEGLVADRLLEIPEMKRRYRERVALLLTNVFRADVLNSRIDELQARLRPVLAAMNPNLAREHDHAVRDRRQKIVQRIAYLQRLVNEPPPRPLAFSRDGVARLREWYPHDLAGNSELKKIADGNRTQLHIRRLDSPNKGSPSWRCPVMLEEGHYQLEGRVRTENVVSQPSSRGEGAGVRISQPRSPRSHKVVGTTSWTEVAYEFSVQPGGDDVMLICDLIAVSGEAWFDLDSLKLRKMPAPRD